MCYAVIEVKLKNEKTSAISGDLRKIDSKEALSKELVQLERIGTVEKVTVFYNHHTHRLTEAWVDEMYVEPVVEVVREKPPLVEVTASPLRAI